MHDDNHSISKRSGVNKQLYNKRLKPMLKFILSNSEGIGIQAKQATDEELEYFGERPMHIEKYEPIAPDNVIQFPMDRIKK